MPDQNEEKPPPRCGHGAEPGRCRTAGCPHHRCLHGATAGECVFADCAHFRLDGPRDERWAFHPDATAADIAAAITENTEQHTRAPGSASPIHLVVERHRQQRVEIEGGRIARCPTCGSYVDRDAIKQPDGA